MNNRKQCPTSRYNNNTKYRNGNVAHQNRNNYIVAGIPNVSTTEKCRTEKYHRIINNIMNVTVSM
jgi:hypothetical protein